MQVLTAHTSWFLSGLPFLHPLVILPPLHRALEGQASPSLELLFSFVFVALMCLSDINLKALLWEVFLDSPYPPSDETPL